MALRPSGMTNDQWKQLSSVMEPNVDDAGKKLAAAKLAQAASISALDKIQNQRSALIRPAAENRLGQTWGAREATAFARDGTGRALPILDKRLDEANSKVESFNSQIQRLQQQSDTNRALASVGAAPVLQQPDYGARPQIPAVAAPKSPTQQTPQRPSPTQTPTSPQTGVGASVGAGGAAPIRPGDPNTFTGTNGITRRVPMPGTMDAATNQSGSVQSQNFGNPVVPQAQTSIAQPRVASTFGLGVNDPRINEQTAPVARPQVSFRGPDAMAEAYNSREDREARQKVLSDLDSQRFRLEMIAGNPGRRGRAALEALGQNAQQQAALAAGGEKLSADAVQGRASRNNVLANTGMEQSGQTQRQQIAGDVASQGQFLDYDAKNRATNASLIDKPQYVTDRSGNLVQVAGGKGAGVTGADGSVIKMPQTTKVDNDALSAVSKELTALINNPPEMGTDATAYNNRLAELRAQQSAFLGGGQQAKPPAGYPNAKQAPDGKWYVKKDGATYLVN